MIKKRIPTKNATVKKSSLIAIKELTEADINSTLIQTSTLQGYIELFADGKLYGWAYDAARLDDTLAINTFEIKLTEILVSESAKTNNNKSSNKSKKASIQGHIEGFEQGTLFGWAYDPEHPNDALIINICTGNEIINEGIVADIYRDHLKEAGFGEGRHAFSIQLDTGWLFDDNIKLKLTLPDGQPVSSNVFEINLKKQLLAELKQQGLDDLIIIENLDFKNLRSLNKNYNFTSPYELVRTTVHQQPSQAIKFYEEDQENAQFYAHEQLGNFALNRFQYGLARAHFCRRKDKLVEHIT